MESIDDRRDAIDSRAGEPWANHEDWLLRHLMQRGEPLHWVAERLSRSVPAVRARWTLLVDGPKCSSR